MCVYFSSKLVICLPVSTEKLSFSKFAEEKPESKTFHFSLKYIFIYSYINSRELSLIECFTKALTDEGNNTKHLACA